MFSGRIIQLYPLSSWLHMESYEPLEITYFEVLDTACFSQIRIFLHRHPGAEVICCNWHWVKMVHAKLDWPTLGTQL